MDVIAALQAQSLLAVIEAKDGDYFMRRVYRWYSTTFHTPLHEVEDLPPEYVLQHYFESVYEALSDKDRETALKELLQEEAEQGQSEEDFIKQIVKEEKKSTRKRKKKTKEALNEAKAAEEADLLLAAERIKQVAEKMANLNKSMDNISVKFDSDNLEDEDTLAPARKP